MSARNIALAVGAAAAIGALVTAPLWLPRLFGQTPKRCRCGAEIGPSGIAPYCTCEY